MAEAGTATPSRLDEALAIARHHIVLVAMTGTLAFGWLITGRYLVALALIVGVDWFVINLQNRITDLAEDERNRVPGTASVARRRGALTVLSAALLIGSFAATALVWPWLTPLRVLVQLIGLGYNYRVVPTRRGWSRFKEIYFLKNFGSAVLFVLTCFAYPLAVAGASRRMPWDGIAALALFFLLFEHSFEILYDFRDLDGDRALAVPTYPVSHGPAAGRRILGALLVASVLPLVAGMLSGGLGVREGLMLVAPLTQYLFYRRRLARGLSARDCVLLTHLASAELALFLVGTAVWQAAGLPANVYLAARPG